MVEYITRYKRLPHGGLEEFQVPKTEVLAFITRLLQRDKEMLDILAKL